MARLRGTFGALDCEGPATLQIRWNIKGPDGILLEPHRFSNLRWMISMHSEDQELKVYTLYMLAEQR